MRENGHLHTFSAGELASQKAFGSVRQRLLRPLLETFDHIGVTPDLLSLCGLLSTVLIPLGLLQTSAHTVLTAYLLHLAFDGMDGALARHLKVTSARGAYLDVVVDHSALLVTLLTVQGLGMASPFWILLYTVGYFTLVVHFVAMNARGSPPPVPVWRTKYILFLLVTLHTYSVLAAGVLNLFFTIIGAYYMLMALLYILLFRWSLPSSSSSPKRS